MKIINNELWMEFQEMVETGAVSSGYLRKAKSEGTNCWTFMDDPADCRKVLIKYEDLKDVYKKVVVERWGDPYVAVARMPILRMVNNSGQWAVAAGSGEIDVMPVMVRAEEYFKRYRYELNGKEVMLDIRTVRKYMRSVAWLEMLQMVQEDRTIIKKELGLKVPEFYEHAGQLIGVEKVNGKSEGYEGAEQLPGDFPTAYQRIMGRVEKYQKEGFEGVIDARFGNKNSAKLGKICPEKGENNGGFDPELKERQLSVIRATAALHVNLPATKVAKLVNKLFEAQGWEKIGKDLVKRIMLENKELLTPGRRGKREWMSNMSQQVKRSRPKLPTYYWTLDGWTAELFYQEDGSYHNRLVVVVVLDAMNNYPVGYAIGERETVELIKQANRNAIAHLAKLTGGLYRPWQIQSDHYGISQMTPFYEAMAGLYTPAQVGNAKAKVIEPYFKYLNDNYCQLEPNWGGHNVTAVQKNQVNAEYLNMIKKNFPDRKGVERQIHLMMAQERKAKVEQYMAGWALLPLKDRLPMELADRISVFGQIYGDRNVLTGQGLVKQIGGVQYVYDSFEPGFRQARHVKWQLTIDMEDPRYALAESEDGKLRYVLEEKMVVPMALKEAQPEHHAHRARIAEANKKRVQEITDTYARDAEVMREVVAGSSGSVQEIDSRDMKLLQVMFTDGKGQQKEGLQDAKGLKGVAAGSGRKQLPVGSGSGQKGVMDSDAQMRWLEEKMDLDF